MAARRVVKQGGAQAAVTEAVSPHGDAGQGGAALADDPFELGAAPGQVGAPPVEAPEAASASPQQAVPQPVDFVSAPSPWGVVVEDVTSLDVPATYARLRDELSLGEAVAHRGEVLAALDKADSNAFEALKLARLAKLHEETEEREVEVQLEVMRSEARSALEVEKENGLRKKAITNDDVADYVRAHWPEKSRGLEERRGQARAVRATAEGLRSDWQSRVASLRSILDAR